MAVSRGLELLKQTNPNPEEVRKSIAALILDAAHIQKCINANFRDRSSGEASIDEILNIIQQLKQKL